MDGNRERLKHLGPGAQTQRQGSIPAIAASAVITMGRKRRRPACTIASSAENPDGAKTMFRIEKQDSFLATIPITMMRPMKESRC